MNKSQSYILVLFICLLSFPIVHELGHFIIAKLLGGEIMQFSYLYISIIPGSIETLEDQILFKYGGLIFTFYPSLIIYFYLYKIKSNFKHIFLSLLFLSPISSTSDLLDIYKLLF
jgi:hypothetical protein